MKKIILIILSVLILIAGLFVITGCDNTIEINNRKETDSSEKTNNSKETNYSKETNNSKVTNNTEKSNNSIETNYSETTNNSKEANNKVETREKDYSGTYKSDDSSEIMIEKENNTYKVNISLYRLANFSDGIVDEIKDDIIYISATDPNDKIIKFTFNYNTKTLIVTETTWTYLNVNDSFVFDN